jgi:hypothetical protein
MIALMVSGVACWTIGGTGHKWVRRYLWGVIALITTWGLMSNWLVIGMGLTLIATATLPYGERTPWWAKILVFTSLGIHVCFLDPIFGLWWALGTGISLSLLMLLSRTYSRVTWKVFEGFSGFLQSVGIILGVLR